MHVERDVDEVLSNRLADDIALLVRGVLQELLTEVIAEGICKKIQMNGMIQSLDWLAKHLKNFDGPVINSAK